MFLEKKKSRILLSAVILLLFAYLLGCASQKPEQANNESVAASEKAITIAWPRDIGTMNPHLYNPSQLIAQSMIYEPLISYGEGGELKPQLAESWEISEDGKVYTFKLRENVKFTDGSTFNANVVKKNFDAIMKNAEMHSWLGVISVIEKTEAVGEYGFKLTLKEAYYPTLQELAVVRPVRFLGEAGFPDDGDTSKGIKEAVGTGPWILADYKTDEYAVFKGNENYWGEAPQVDQVTIKVIPDAETRVLAFEKGEIDLIYGEGIISLDSFKQLKESGEYETSISEPVATRQLVMNTEKAQLSDVQVRLALQYGFNKQAMVDGITSGLEEKADYILPANLPYTDIDVAPIDYDVEKAQALLDAAGWILPSGKAVREKNGQQLEIELMYDSKDSIQKAMAETLQAEWSAIGVKLNIVGVELTVQIKRFKGNDYELNFFSNYGAPYDPHTFVNIISEEGFGFSNTIANDTLKAELDQQVSDVLQTTDETEREALYKSILTTLQEEGSILPISYLKKIAVFHKGVTNFTFPANRDEHPFTDVTISK